MGDLTNLGIALNNCSVVKIYKGFNLLRKRLHIIVNDERKQTNNNSPFLVAMH